MKSCLFLLLALSAAALVGARLIQDDGVTGRSLAQLPTGSASAYCPAGCDRDFGGCIQDATQAGLRCQSCLGTLFVNKINGNCSCPAGKYATELIVSGKSIPQCTDCPKGWFCPGGDFSGIGSPNRTQCPDYMTTVGKRSLSNRACVQLPGYYYTISSDGKTVGAVQCAADSYSPGLKKQRACVPCPTGFTTNGTIGATSPVQCLVPAGYYLKAPGQVAPCPQGEYKEGLGTAANCTKCVFGVTTPTEAAVHRNSCSILMPGYFAQAMDGPVITQTVICPQGYYCPGGAANTSFTPTPVGGNRRLLQVEGTQIIRCATGWTVDVGSSSVEQCLVPPGYYWNGTDTVKCASGSYRADWKPAADATACTSCGDGVQAALTDQIKVYNDSLGGVVYWFEPVTTSADDCFIQPGQGLYYTSTTGTWRARNCDSNTYGVSGLTYGLTPAPCRDCPSNMVAINNATYSNSSKYWSNTTTDSTYTTYGFTDVKACVTQAGYGYNGRVAQKCEKGYWNTANNYDDCTQCAYGLTTADVGAGTQESDCGIGAGFGLSGGVIRECPIGTYNNNSWVASRTAACTPCPTGTTTQGTGSNNPEQCNLCQVGYGGVACNQTCGGDVADPTAVAPGTYGPAGRSPTDDTNRECVACTTQQTGYSFSWQFQNDFVPVPSISPLMANASTDCLAKYSQTFDGAWYMPDTGNSTSVFTVAQNSFQACVDECNNWGVGAAAYVPNTYCQWVTYDYTLASNNCKVRYTSKQVYVGAPVVGFKAVPSGDVGTNAWSIDPVTGKEVEPKDAAAKALASGRYTMYQDEYGLEIGNWIAADGRVGQVAPANAGSFTDWQQCLNACDDDHACTGFIIRLTTVVANRPKTCMLFYGRTDLGEFKRTFVRADISMLNDLQGRLI